MTLEKKPHAEPIPGYALIEQLGKGGFGEVWKCEAPGGIFKAIKFVYGNINGLSSVSQQAENELRAVQHVKSIRHPFLLSIDRVECIDGELVIVMELADRSLHDLLTKYQAAGQIGIPRLELLFYMREVAEVLDLLNHQCNLQHLDIKPRNLFLVGNHVKVADFGLVQSLSAHQASVQTGAITPLYAAPELFQGTLSPHCDQYSLAIVYQELLTGTLPFNGVNARQLLMQHTQDEPNLQPLPDSDRPIIQKALQKNPDKRFTCCKELVHALFAEGGGNLTRTEYDIDVEVPSPSTAETQHQTSKETQRWHAPSSPSLPLGVLPGQRFIECLQNSPLIETWKTQNTDGKPQLVQFVYGCTVTDPQKLHELGKRLTSLQHPGLLPTQIVHAEPGRFICKIPLVQETLRERFMECQRLKQPGIMRGELVDYVRAAAEILDYLYQQHSVLHLWLNPRTLVLDRGWLQLSDFGLAHLVWMPGGQDIAQRNIRYSAPELFERELNRTVDQFSLALIYAELLTGHHPFPTQEKRRKGQPDLENLSAQDRGIIARALDADPAKRWPTATEMALALEGSHPQTQLQEAQSDPFIQLLKQPPSVSGLPSTKTLPEDLTQQISELLINLGAREPDYAAESAPILSEEQLILEHRFQVCLPLGIARQHLEPFFRELGGQLVHKDDNSYVVKLPLPSTFWQRMRRQEPAALVRIELSRVNPMSATPVELKVHMSTHNLDRGQALKILEQSGPGMLERVRKHVLVGSEKQIGDRLLWPYQLQIVPVHADGQKDEPIECRGKDISFTGLGLYIPHELDTNEVILQVPSTVHPPALSIPATLVRAHRCADGWYDVGALFHLPALKKSMAEICMP